MTELRSIGTAFPGNQVEQARLQEVAEAVIPETAPARDRMLDVFDASGVGTRYLAMDLGWYLESHGHAERNAAFARVGLELVEQAADQALRAAGVDVAELGGVVLVSTTGMATPSLDARLCNRLDAPPDLVRVPVWGLGCAGGVAGMNRAFELARVHGAPFLVVALELCSLQFSLDKALGGNGADGALDKKTVVAATLFGDGCAAAVVGPAEAPARARHLAGKSHLFPDTERIMGWDVEDDTLDVVLSPKIPRLAGRELDQVVFPFLDQALGPGHRPDHWALHPGGAKVLTAFRKALGLDQADLAAGRHALERYGNVSSPTVFLALEHVLDQQDPVPGDTVLMAALGPGFAAELSLLEVAA